MVSPNEPGSPQLPKGEASGHQSSAEQDGSDQPVTVRQMRVPGDDPNAGNDRQGDGHQEMPFRQVVKSP
jgi:hypothetical protein